MASMERVSGEIISARLREARMAGIGASGDEAILRGIGRVCAESQQKWHVHLRFSRAGAQITYAEFMQALRSCV